MARNDDDFNDIPDLGPAGDDLDGSRIPTLKKETRAQKTASRAPGKPSRGGSGNGVLYALLLALILALAGFGAWSYQQQARLQGQLSQAQETLGQSQDRIAHLENLISATDESASKSGAALQARINRLAEEEKKRTKLVDSEIAKLWTVAYQRNKPQIEALDKAAQAREEQLGALSESSKALQSSLQKLEAQFAELNQKLATQQKDLRSLGASHQSQATEQQRLAERLRTQDAANQELDALQEQQLKALQARVERLQQAPAVPSQLTQQLQEQQKAIESINAYRRQVNQELLLLRERINQLQLSVQQ